jgi:hypothetical protein
MPGTPGSDRLVLGELPYISRESLFLHSTSGSQEMAVAALAPQGRVAKTVNIVSFTRSETRLREWACWTVLDGRDKRPIARNFMI